MISIATKIKNAWQAKPKLVSLCFIWAVTTLVYFQVYDFRFIIGWDDQIFITNHYTSDGFTAKNLYAILTEFYSGQYAPVNQLYYTLVCYFFEYDPMYYHTGGVLIHLINVVLVYFLTLRIANKLCTPNKTDPNIVALFTTLLFALSPVNLEPVVWVAATKVTIYALFYFAALHCYLNFIETKRPLYYGLTVVCFILSFGGKEQAVVLPLCLLLLDMIYNQDLTSKWVWYTKAPFFILAIFFGLITLWSHGIEDLADTADFYPLHQRALLSLYTVSEYFTKCLLPANLSFVYPFPFQIGERPPFWIWIYPPATILAIILLWQQFKKKWVIFGLLFFFIHLLVFINIISLARHAISADRYLYVATIGLYFMVGYGIATLSRSKRFRGWAWGIAIIYATYFTVFTYQHIGVWRNVLTLKKHIRETIKSRSDYPAWRKKAEQNEGKN